MSYPFIFAPKCIPDEHFCASLMLTEAAHLFEILSIREQAEAAEPNEQNTERMNGLPHTTQKASSKEIGHPSSCQKQVCSINMHKKYYGNNISEKKHAKHMGPWDWLNMLLRWLCVPHNAGSLASLESFYWACGFSKCFQYEGSMDLWHFMLLMLFPQSGWMSQ